MRRYSARVTLHKRPRTFPQPCWSTPRGTKTGQSVPTAVLPVVGCVDYSSILFLTEDLWLSFAYKSAVKCTHLSTIYTKKASPKRGWLFVVSRFCLRVRVLLDLGPGGGETGVKINHLRSRCKHTVNNALKQPFARVSSISGSCVCQ